MTEQTITIKPFRVTIPISRYLLDDKDRKTLETECLQKAKAEAVKFFGIAESDLHVVREDVALNSGLAAPSAVVTLWIKPVKDVASCQARLAAIEPAAYNKLREGEW
jgi:hypothetical protein